MSTAERLQRSAKRLETLARKAEQAENDNHTPLRSFVRVDLDDPSKAYHGLIGQVHSHNDLATKDHPNIPKEIGVKFAPTATPVWFLPSELKGSQARPKTWVTSE